jgi:hypothetical protein
MKPWKASTKKVGEYFECLECSFRTQSEGGNDLSQCNWNHVHCSQETSYGISLVSIDRWMDMKMWQYRHNGVLFIHKEEWKYVICKKMNGTGNHHGKQDKPNSKSQILKSCGF